LKKSDTTPELGQYDGSMQQFGSGLNKVGFGAKYEFKADSNPAVGAYDVETAVQATKTRTRAA